MSLSAFSAGGTTENVEVTAFFEHPAYDVAIIGDWFFTDRANSDCLGGVAIAVWTTEYLG